MMGRVGHVARVVLISIGAFLRQVGSQTDSSENFLVIKKRNMMYGRLEKAPAKAVSLKDEEQVAR